MNSNYLVVDRKYNVEYLKEVLNFLNEKKVELNVEFVYGKGKRKTKIQRNIELLEEIIEKQNYYDLCNKLFCGRNSFSKTDPSATFMHMKEDHMRNSQLKPGYNVQIGVEAEYIVGIDISSERSDILTLIPFLNTLELNLRRKYLKLIADAGYESEENYNYLEKHNIRAFIKPVTYDIINKRSFKNRIGRYENMQYDSSEDTYTCYNDKKLIPIGKKIRKSKSGFQSTLTVYECEDCSNCTYKSKCTKANGNRRLDLSKNFIEKRRCSLENIKSQEGIILRTNRSIQAEGAFGVIKEDHNFRRFLLRGHENVKIEFLIKALAYDVEKLHNKTQQKRNGQQLHCEAIA